MKLIVTQSTFGLDNVILASAAPSAARMASISAENGCPSTTVIVVAIVRDPEALVVALWTAVEVPLMDAPLEAPAGAVEETPPAKLVEEEPPIVGLIEDEPLFVTDRATPNV